MQVRSLSIRFIVSALIAVTAGFTLFISTVYTRLDASLKIQVESLEQLATDNMSDLLKADMDLAAARLRFLSEDVARRTEAITYRADVADVIASRNNVAISELLGPAARNADVDTLIVLDRDLNVIGGSSDTYDLVAIGRAIGGSTAVAAFRTAMRDAETDRTRPLVMLLTSAELPTVDGWTANAFAQLVVLQPMWDEFGEVAGAVLARRSIRPREATLEEFATITKVGIAVFSGDRLVSSAGLDFADLTAPPQGFMDPSRHFVSHCGVAMAKLTICTLKPIVELYRAQDQVTKIGRAETIDLVRWLVLVGVGSSVCLMGVLWLAARPITRPMRRLAQAVGQIADGIYDAPIEGQQRLDEVGSIARAVATLNDSVKERDLLRADILEKNAILLTREAQLRTQNRLFDAALNNMSHGLCMFDKDQRLIVSNRRYEEIFGMSRGDAAPGLGWEELKALENIATETVEAAYDAVVPVHGGESQRTVAHIQLNDGRTILTTRQPLVGGGWVAIYEDVTERQRARERLVHQARHDALTGLPNRVALREHLGAQLATLQTSGGAFGVLCLDLDEFKTINDTLGHPAGDRLLCEVAQRLRACIDETELVTRLGGDEFAIVTSPVSSAEGLAIRCEEIIRAISGSFTIDDHDTPVSVSIGVSIAPTNARDPDSLLKQADLALYKAKFEGRNTYRFFETEMEVAVRARHDMITDLRGAIAGGEMEAHYQPQVSFATGEVVGFEALMRWRSRRLGMVSPMEFIPLAEETGLIVPLGEWILREATREASLWPDPVRVAVNISARQLQRPDFQEVVRSAIRESGLPPYRLELEVTESVLLGDDAVTRDTLSALKTMGVKISLDDFGTGYSSLSCLRSFPFDKIKIDQSFVRAIPTSDEAKSIVAAVISLARELGIATTAEGVETQDLYDMLKYSGTTEGQGYWIGRPEPARKAYERLHPPAAASNAPR